MIEVLTLTTNETKRNEKKMNNKKQIVKQKIYQFCKDNYLIKYQAYDIYDYIIGTKTKNYNPTNNDFAKFWGTEMESVAKQTLVDLFGFKIEPFNINKHKNQYSIISIEKFDGLVVNSPIKGYESVLLEVKCPYSGNYYGESYITTMSHYSQMMMYMACFGYSGCL